jgi:hypothetical protein
VLVWKFDRFARSTKQLMDAFEEFRHRAWHERGEAKQIISPAAKGIVTDRWGSYNWLAPRRQQICRAHLKRDFEAMVNRPSESAQIGKALLEQERKLFRLWHQVRDGTLSHDDFRWRIKPLRQRVKSLLQQATQSGHKKTRRVGTNILNVEPPLWTFVRVDGVEPTNNDAERPLRRAVLWRRKSFSTRRGSGSRVVEQILTAMTSLRQPGQDVLEFLTRACSDLSTDFCEPAASIASTGAYD